MRNGPYTHQASTEEGDGHCCRAGSQIALPNFGTGGIAIDTGGIQFPPTERGILQIEEESNCLQQEESKNPTSQEQEGRRIPSTWNTKALACLPSRPCYFLNMEERICSHAER